MQCGKEMNMVAWRQKEQKRAFQESARKMTEKELFFGDYEFYWMSQMFDQLI